VRIDKNDMYTGMGIVRALPGPVFSIASFTGGMALKDYGKTPEEKGIMQLLGCVIGTVAIFFTKRIVGFILFSNLA
jgi:chromate transporter